MGGGEGGGGEGGGGEGGSEGGGGDEGGSEMMQLITDQKLRSTPHRVVKYKTEEPKSRYSIPFFMHPSPDTILKSVFNDDDNGVLAHDFLDERLKAIKLY